MSRVSTHFREAVVQARLVVVMMFGAVVTMHVASPTALDAQCRPDDAAAQPFGPRVSPADSGRMYSYVLSADGREFYFFKRVGTAPENYRIFRSLRSGSDWGPAEQLSLGGDYSDLYPSLSPDGARLVFSSYRPAPGDTSSHPNAHLWMARRQGNGWGPPEFVRASRLGYYHSGLSQDDTGTLHFRLTTPDWHTQHDAELRWTGTGFASAITNSPGAPAAEYARQQSGDSLYVWGAVTGAGGLSLVSVSRVLQPGNRRAPAQYFVTYLRPDGWTPLVRAGGGLGVGAPNFAWFSPDGCYLHYTRDYSEFMRVSVRALVAR